LAGRRGPPLTLPLAALGLLVALWLSVERLERWLRSSPEAAPGDARADELVARGLFPGGLPSLLQLQRLRYEDGVWQAVLVTESASPVEELRPLVRRAREAGWEAHATSVGTIGAELRLYGASGLRVQVAVEPAPRPLIQVDRPGGLRERPLLSIVVHNLGDRDVSALIETPFPLGLAVLPYRPHSLRIARAGVRAGHEVLMELPRSESSSAEDRAAALQAVPWASGVLVLGASPSSLPPLPFGVFVSGAARPSAETLSGYAVVSAVVAAQPMAGLAEAQRRCAEERAAVLVVDAQNGELRDVLEWAARFAEEAGYRLALPSEVARADQVAGLLDPPLRAPPPVLDVPVSAAPTPPAPRPPPTPAGARAGATAEPPAATPARDLGALELD
jgi:hypothetical protein